LALSANEDAGDYPGELCLGDARQRRL